MGENEMIIRHPFSKEYQIYVLEKFRKDKYIIVILAFNKGTIKEHILLRDGTSKDIIEEYRKRLEYFYGKDNVKVNRYRR
jgi:hypothetical protein